MLSHCPEFINEFPEVPLFRRQIVALVKENSARPNEIAGVMRFYLAAYLHMYATYPMGGGMRERTVTADWLN